MASTDPYSNPDTIPSQLLHWWEAKPEGWLIQKILFLMIAGCIAGMILDGTGYYRTGILDVPEESRKLAPVDIPRPEPGDNLRPYQPGMVPRPTPYRPAEPSLPDGTPLPETVPVRMQFSFSRNRDGVPFIIASGNLDTGTAEEFKRFDQTHAEKARYLFLVSHGGLVHEAVQMGQYVRDRKMKTIVPREGFCFSACPLIMAGGIERIAYPNSWVGLHQIYLAGDRKPSPDEAFETGQRSVAEIMVYLEKLDVDPKVWRIAITTPPDQIHMLSDEDLLETNLATAVTKDVKLE